MDRHILNLVSLGMGFFGGLYLSYDLLGQKGGLLRRLMAGLPIGIGAYIAIQAWGLPGRLLTWLLSLVATIFGMFVFYGFIKSATFAEGATNLVGFWIDFDNKSKISRLQNTIVTIACVIGLIYDAYQIILTTTVTNNEKVAYSTTFVCVLIAEYLALRADRFTERRLGAIGAALTTLAFAFQFYLAW